MFSLCDPRCGQTFLRHLHRAEIGQFRIILPVEIETGAPDAEVEGRVVGDHGGAAKVVGEFVHDFGKLACVLHMLRADAVDCDVEGGEAHGLRTDEPFLDPHDPAILDPGQTDRTGTAALLVGGFEINGDGLQRGVPTGLARQVLKPYSILRAPFCTQEECCSGCAGDSAKSAKGSGQSTWRSRQL